MTTVRHSGHKDVLKLISPDHGVIIKDCSCRNISSQYIISNIVKSLFPCLILVHMERVIHLSGKNSFSPSLDSIDWRRKILDFSLTKQPLSANFIIS